MADDTFSDLRTLLQNIGNIYDRDLRGATSPFRQEISPKKDGVNYTEKPAGYLAAKDNFFKLDSYKWYTSDLQRIFADDYYNKMYDRSGFFNTYIESFPFAKVYEFKPRDTLGMTINALTTAFKTIDTLIDSNGVNMGTVNKIWDGVKDFLAKEFKITSISKAFTDPDTRINGIPNGIYKRLISGYYTGYYEIPVLEYTGYLTSNGGEGWKSQSFMQRFFTDYVASTAKDFMSSKIGSGLDIATRPKWGIEGGGESFPSINLEVVLFNDNFDSVIQNLSFIHSYIAGNLWYQDGFIQKCSSLYDVEIPGRFRYYFCKCDVEVNYVGKVRKVNSSKLATYDNVKINPTILNNIPDAYRILFKFNSVIPNNFNSYVAYLTQTTESNISVGTNINSFYEQLASSINASVTGETIKNVSGTEVINGLTNTEYPTYGPFLTK